MRTILRNSGFELLGFAGIFTNMRLYILCLHMHTMLSTPYLPYLPTFDSLYLVAARFLLFLLISSQFRENVTLFILVFNSGMSLASCAYFEGAIV